MGNPASPAAPQADLSPAERVAAALTLIEDEDLSFKKSCEQAGINRGDAWRIICASTELSIRYARARAARGNRQGEAIVELGADVLAGKYTPDVARVALDAMKWAAARMHPAVYGERQAVEHSGPNGGPMQFSVVERRVIDPSDGRR